MSDWLNHAVLAAPNSGTTNHTVTASGTGGTVVGGAGFTPTSGRLLLCFAEGAVTSTTPTGWTLPTNGSAINNTGLYVWWRVASGTSADQVATTHNGSSYSVGFDFFEFASGSSFVASASAISVSGAGGAGPTLSGLTGTNWTAGIVGAANTSTTTVRSVTWNAGTEVTDSSVVAAGVDAYGLGVTETNANTATSVAYAATVGGAAPVPTVERLVVAVNVAGGAAPAIPPIIVLAPRR